MKIRHLLSAGLCFFSVSVSAADGDQVKLPALKDTKLYTEIASGCWSVDLKTWKGSLKTIFNRYRLQPFDVESCNEGSYFIIHTTFKYDPEDGSKYDYKEYFKDLLHQNGNQPMSVVDENWGKVMNLSWVDRELHIDTEPYDH